MSDEHGWRAFSAGDLDKLPPEERTRAEQALAEYQALVPIAEVHILIHDWRPGQSEIRYSGPPADAAPGWHQRLIDTAIEELRRSRTALGDP